MAAAISVVPFAKLHMRLLLLNFRRQFKPHCHLQNCRIRLKSYIKDSLHWWIVPENIFVGMPFRQKPPTLKLTTDASLTGWGAHMKGMTASALWTEEEAILHINVLELKTILLELRTFIIHIQGQVVAICTDNTMAMSYVNRQGGTISRTLCHLVLQIWELCIQHNIHPQWPCTFPGTRIC